MSWCYSAMQCSALVELHVLLTKGSRKAVADMIPVRLETRIVIPVSRNGTEKSITFSLKTNGHKVHRMTFMIGNFKRLLYDKYFQDKTVFMNILNAEV